MSPWVNPDVKLAAARQQTRDARLRLEQMELARTLRKPGEWVEHAECRNYDREIFYPRDEAGASYGKWICSTKCPVMNDCLEFALRTQEPHGTWGGLTADERAKMQGRPKRR